MCVSYKAASVEKALIILLTEFKDPLQKTPQTRRWTLVEDLPKHPVPLNVAQVRTRAACNSINEVILQILPMSCADQEEPGFPYQHILAVCASLRGHGTPGHHWPITKALPSPQLRVKWGDPALIHEKQSVPVVKLPLLVSGTNTSSPGLVHVL